MSADTSLIAAAASLTVSAGGVVAFLKWLLPRTRTRRLRAEKFDELLHGKDDEKDARGQVIEEGFAPIAVQVRDLSKLVTSGLVQQVKGLAEAQATITAGQDHIQATIDQNTTNIAVARAEATRAAHLAGDAAMTADRVAQKHDDSIGLLDQKISAIDSKVEELREVTRERLERAETKAEAMWAIAIELGMPEDA